jgi:hypothetical protein
MRAATWFVLLALEVPALAMGQGINTNAALPVAKGEVIWRSQLRATVATDDPSPMGRELRTLVQPQTLAIGITPRLTLFATLPVLARRRTEMGGSSRRAAPALGDAVLLARYMLFIDDYGPLSTRRVALLGGLKLPTGADRFGTPSYDPIIGAVGTWAANRHELDVDVLYRLTTERQNFEAGDSLRYDLAYRYRLWPKKFGRGLLQLNGVLELNGSWEDRASRNGDTIRASGGHILFLAPGVQLASNRWILEASLQLPVVQDLHGSQVETDFVGVLSVRIPFLLDSVGIFSKEQRKPYRPMLSSSD